MLAGSASICRHLKSLAILGIFLICCLGIWQWQGSLSTNTTALTSITGEERLSAAVGICAGDDELGRMVYFFNNLGLLPVTSTQSPFSFGRTRKGAEEFVRRHGNTLRNDLPSPCGLARDGDLGKFYLLDPVQLSTKGRAGMIFKCALLLLLGAAFLQRSYFLGLCLVVLVGSYRFQLYEAYVNRNVFSIFISTGILLLGLQFKFLARNSSQPSRYDWIAPVVSGVVLAISHSIRGDSLPFAAVVVLAYVLSGQRPVRVALLAIVFVSSFLSSAFTINHYFSFKIRQADTFIVEAGGKLNQGEPLAHHPFWYTLAAGLGDFGTDRGFVWSDRRMFEKILPIFNQRVGKNYISNGFFFMEPNTPAEEWIKPELHPEVVRIFRERVLSEILKDPVWYLGVIKKRIQRTAGEGTSSGARILAPSGESVWIPLSLWMLFPLLVYVGVSRQVFHLRLLAFSCAFAAIPVLVTAQMGTHNFSIVHLIFMAVVADATLKLCALGFNRIQVRMFWRTESNEAIPATSSHVPS